MPVGVPDVELAVLGTDVSPAEYERATRAIREYERRQRRAGVIVGESAVPRDYAFVPQAGLLERDNFFNNFVDLDPSDEIRDWNCEGYTYDTHQGHDIDLRSFGEQDVGVPVYAALDGTVVEVEDGNFDRSTDLSPKDANFVIIDHGEGQYGYYWHFRKNSISVAANDEVVAGQQIGLVGSSGYSSGPHLHFETQLDGRVIEPFAGDCNEGSSGWSRQPRLKRKTLIRDAGITHRDLGQLSEDELPPEPFPRSGQLALGDPQANFWLIMNNLPADSTWRWVFRRPNDSVAFDSGDRDIGNDEFVRGGWWTAWWDIDDMHRIEGAWKVDVHVNGRRLVERMPVEVRERRTKKFNRAPNKIRKVKFSRRPRAGTPAICEIKHDLVKDDPDYDIVRYRYLWEIGNRVVRDIVSAAHSDVLAVDQFAKGNRLTCTVTPSDGDLEGPGGSVRKKVK